MLGRPASVMRSSARQCGARPDDAAGPRMIDGKHNMKVGRVEQAYDAGPRRWLLPLDRGAWA